MQENWLKFKRRCINVVKESNIYQDIYRELEKKRPNDYPAPDAPEVDEIEEPLFDSQRGYIEQNEIYQKYKKGEVKGGVKG